VLVLALALRVLLPGRLDLRRSGFLVLLTSGGPVCGAGLFGVKI
jgi:hypothetical protein